jgi:hypothetical protein
VDARSSVLTRGKRALVIVTDYGNGGEVKLTLDRAALVLPADVTAKDFETGEACGFSFNLKKHDFKAVLVE